MNTPATTARDNANSFEAVKHGQRQMQGTDWAITFKIAQTELLDTPLHEAPNGTRYMVALVEVDDDETPVVQADKLKGGRRARQAGICCNDPRFWRFLSEERNEYVHNGGDASMITRRACGVSARSMLDHDEIAGAAWDELHSQYEGWLIK